MTRLLDLHMHPVVSHSPPKKAKVPVLANDNLQQTGHPPLPVAIQGISGPEELHLLELNRHGYRWHSRCVLLISP